MQNKLNTASVLDLPAKQRIQTSKAEMKKLPILKTHQPKLLSTIKQQSIQFEREDNIPDDEIILKNAYLTARPITGICKSNFISKNINHITKLSLDAKNYKSHSRIHQS